LRAIAAVDDRVVVGGFFAGAITLGKRQLSTKNGDGFFAVVNGAARSKRAGTPPALAAKRSPRYPQSPAASSLASRTPRHSSSTTIRSRRPAP
jgi:hypothetical protein